MNEKTKKQIETLKGSIEKWELIVRGEGVNRGHDNCPCCQEYNPDTNAIRDGTSDCINCPILEYTGFRYCDRTPYMEWANYTTPKCRNHIYSDVIKKTIDPEAQRLAQAELDFLKEILLKLESQP